MSYGPSIDERYSCKTCDKGFYAASAPLCNCKPHGNHPWTFFCDDHSMKAAKKSRRLSGWQFQLPLEGGKP